MRKVYIENKSHSGMKKFILIILGIIFISGVFALTITSDNNNLPKVVIPSERNTSIININQTNVTNYLQNDSYVPFNNSASNVDLNNKNLSNVDWLSADNFNSSAFFGDYYFSPTSSGIATNHGFWCLSSSAFCEVRTNRILTPDGVSSAILYNTGTNTWTLFGNLFVNTLLNATSGNIIRNLNVGGNSTSSYFIGNGSLLNGVCLANGTGCSSSMNYTNLALTNQTNNFMGNNFTNLTMIQNSKVITTASGTDRGLFINNSINGTTVTVASASGVDMYNKIIVGGGFAGTAVYGYNGLLLRNDFIPSGATTGLGQNMNGLYIVSNWSGRYLPSIGGYGLSPLKVNFYIDNVTFGASSAPTFMDLAGFQSGTTQLTSANALRYAYTLTDNANISGQFNFIPLSLTTGPNTYIKDYTTLLSFSTTSTNRNLNGVKGLIMDVYTTNKTNYGTQITMHNQSDFTHFGQGGKAFFENTTLNKTTYATGDFVQTNGNATINNIYGEMWMHDDAGRTFNIASAGVYYPQNVTNNTRVNGFTATLNQTLQAQVAGIYQVNYHGSGGGVANHNYHMAIAKNGVQQYNTETHLRISTGTDVGTMSGTGILSLAVGDNVTLAIEDSVGTGDATIYSLNFNLLRIGN